MVPRQVENNYSGISFLNELLFKVQYLDYNKVVLNFGKTVWFEANLVSILGTAINHAINNNKKVEITKISASIESVFRKNGFLSYYGLSDEVDVYDSTIKYKIFNVNRVEEFANYISDEVIPKIKMTIDKPIEKSLISSLNEVFVNVGQHAQSNSVYTCGQYYYKNKKVAFTIVDLGKTIPSNIKPILQSYDINDASAINWATKYGNTSRKDDSVGGIGLYIIDEFLKDNNGVFQIVSGSGFWEKDHGVNTMYEMNCSFPGTIVNIITKLENTTFNWNEEIIF